MYVNSSKPVDENELSACTFIIILKDDVCLWMQVGSKDTLNTIALQFNITPNKLVQLNRLFSHSVVPGQVSPILHFASHLLAVLSSLFIQILTSV